MATHRKRGKSRYLCWYEENPTTGKLEEKRKSLGSVTIREANAAVSVKEYELRNQSVSATPLFIHFAMEYLRWHEIEYPDSHFRIRQICSDHLYPVFQLMDISSISRKDAEQYKHDRLKSKKHPSPNTVAKELRTLQAIMNKAVEWEILARNPIKGVKPPKDNQDAPPPFYDKDEIGLIYVNSLDLVKKATWQLFLNTGMRRKEMLQLKKSNIDDQGIRILSTGEGRTKSGKWRMVPHTRGTKAALKVLASVDGNFIIPQVNLRSVSRAFDNCLRRAELDGSLKWTRHSYASHLVMSGEHLRKVQILLGHSSIKTTEQYAHLSPDFMDKVRISL